MWGLLQQKLHELKELPSEIVSMFPVAIRQLPQRINLPHLEFVNNFIHLRRSLNCKRKLREKPKRTIAATDRYHPFSHKATREFLLVKRKAVSQIVSQVIHQELRGQNNRHVNYQKTCGRRSLQGQPIGSGPCKVSTANKANARSETK